MTSWKQELRSGDLDNADKLELTCRKCGHVRYLTRDLIERRKGGAMLYLDEVEMRARCIQRGCGGKMRMALPLRGEASGFVGGLA